ncbi:PucR family transcriptional regulator [Fodinicola feengrottensis]|uniref:PucR family transcriptional regulator n=1 Tax=Fodinicola feengrottensis TaxID=435914 RepID=UPI0024435F64|nr:helix-turn-helix domain-containing protein [Fodinicola feengrottensis]
MRGEQKWSPMTVGRTSRTAAAVSAGPRPRRATDPAHADRTRRLWAALPPDLAKVFRPRAAEAAREILQEIQRGVPEYARPLEGPFGEIITAGVESAIMQFIERLGHPGGLGEDEAAMFRGLGRLEFAEGRSPDSLQAAYRIGARMAWRRMSELCQRIGVPAAVLGLLAESLFAYIDELSTLSLEGYALAQARTAGAIERRRKRLVDLLLADPPASPEAIADLAVAAAWHLPEQVAVVALKCHDQSGEHPVPTFDDSVLVDLEGASPRLVAADPRLCVPFLGTELPRWRAAVGPVVPVAEARQSWLLAQRAQQAVQRGLLPDKAVTDCADHLSALWLLSDELLMRTLADRALAPLAALTEKQRARLSETLLAWLQTHGGAPEIAARLGVHPQTVRYRLHQLEKLFGERLRDQDTRFDIELSLRALRLLESTPT